LKAFFNALLQPRDVSSFSTSFNEVEGAGRAAVLISSIVRAAMTGTFSTGAFPMELV
jgi:hypothetical protein